MTPVVALTSLIGLPILVGLVLRVNALYMYTSVVVGQLLVLFVGDDAAIAAGGFLKNQYSQSISQIFLLLLPLVVTILLLRQTMPRTQLIFQLPALIAVGATLFIFTVPLLSSGTVGAILASPIAKSVMTSQDVIIAASGLIIVSTMWLTARQHGHKHGKHHK